MRQVGPKARVFGIAGRIPIVRETADPWIFLALTVLVALTVVGVALPGEVFPDDADARTHVLQVAAGMLLILGAYFTAVNIREARAQQSFERLCRVIEQLGHEDPAVRVASVGLLESIATEALDLPSGSAGAAMQARRRAIREALAIVAERDGGEPAAAKAREVLARLGPEPA